MDWQRAIERHATALMRVVAGLIAMVGAGSAPAADAAEIAADRPTLSRYRHRALLRIVRPAEAAARRLVIALALALPPPPDEEGAPVRQDPQPASQGRPRRQHRPLQPKESPAILRADLGTGIVLAANDPARLAAMPAAPPRILRLPLTDPVRRPRLRHDAPRQPPRISVPGVVEPLRLPPRPLILPDDRLDATRLVLRIRALARALDDLPGEARRFRRWNARRAGEVLRDRAAQDARANAMRGEAARAASRRAAGIRIVPIGGLGLAGVPPAPPPGIRRIRRVSPLRSGRPPGGRRKPVHEVHDILAEAHALAHRALEGFDSS